MYISRRHGGGRCKYGMAAREIIIYVFVKAASSSMLWRKQISSRPYIKSEAEGKRVTAYHHSSYIVCGALARWQAVAYRAYIIMYRNAVVMSCARKHRRRKLIYLIAKSVNGNDGGGIIYKRRRHLILAVISLFGGAYMMLS